MELLNSKLQKMNVRYKVVNDNKVYAKFVLSKKIDKKKG